MRGRVPPSQEGISWAANPQGLLSGFITSHNTAELLRQLKAGNVSPGKQSERMAVRNRGGTYARLPRANGPSIVQRV